MSETSSILNPMELHEIEVFEKELIAKLGVPKRQFDEIYYLSGIEYYNNLNPGIFTHPIRTMDEDKRFWQYYRKIFSETVKNLVFKLSALDPDEITETLIRQMLDKWADEIKALPVLSLNDLNSIIINPN